MLVDIPAGAFEFPASISLPARRMSLPAFRIEATEVTVATYRACVEAGACTAPPKGGGPTKRGESPLPATCNWDQPGRDDHPINCLLAPEADAYCAWDHGRRLPTLFELYWAAMGGPRVPDEHRNDSLKMPFYVWGRAEPETKRLCWQRGSFAGTRGGVLGPIEDVPSPVASDLGTCAVASYADDVSAFGVFDLAANVMELATDPRERPCPTPDRADAPCPRESTITTTGGPWNAIGLTGSLSSKDASPAPRFRSDMVGFRCVEGPAK
jgi:formylglycine-generating enzyme required for sulfatase activity